MFTYDIVKLGDNFNKSLNEYYNNGAIFFSSDTIKDKIVEQTLEQGYDTFKVNLDEHNGKIRSIIYESNLLTNLPIFNKYIVDGSDYYERSYIIFNNPLSEKDGSALLYKMADRLIDECNIKFIMLKHTNNNNIQIIDKDDNIIKRFDQRNFTDDIGVFLKTVHNRFNFDDNVVCETNLYVPQKPQTQWQAGVRSKELFLNFDRKEKLNE